MDNEKVKNFELMNKTDLTQNFGNKTLERTPGKIKAELEGIISKALTQPQESLYDDEDVTSGVSSNFFITPLFATLIKGERGVIKKVPRGFEVGSSSATTKKSSNVYKVRGCFARNNLGDKGNKSPGRLRVGPPKPLNYSTSALVARKVNWFNRGADEKFIGIINLFLGCLYIVITTALVVVSPLYFVLLFLLFLLIYINFKLYEKLKLLRKEWKLKFFDSTGPKLPWFNNIKEWLICNIRYSTIILLVSIIYLYVLKPGIILISSIAATDPSLVLAVTFTTITLLIVYIAVKFPDFNLPSFREMFGFWGFLITLRWIWISILSLLLPFLGGFSFNLTEWLLLLLSTGFISIIPDFIKEKFRVIFDNYLVSASKTLINIFLASPASEENNITGIKNLLKDLIDSYIKYNNAKLNARNIVVQDRNNFLSKKSEARPRPIPFYETLNYQLSQMRHAQSREPWWSKRLSKHTPSGAWTHIKQGILYQDKGFLCFNKEISYLGKKCMGKLRYDPFIKEGFLVVESSKSFILKVWNFKIIKFSPQGKQDLSCKALKWDVKTQVDLSDKWDVKTQVDLSDKWDVETLVDSTISLNVIQKSETCAPNLECMQPKILPAMLENSIRELSNPQVNVNFNDNHNTNMGKGKATQEDIDSWEVEDEDNRQSLQGSAEEDDDDLMEGIILPPQTMMPWNWESTRQTQETNPTSGNPQAVETAATALGQTSGLYSDNPSAQGGSNSMCILPAPNSELIDKETKDWFEWIMKMPIIEDFPIWDDTQPAEKAGTLHSLPEGAEHISSGDPQLGPHKSNSKKKSTYRSKPEKYEAVNEYARRKNLYYPTKKGQTVEKYIFDLKRNEAHHCSYKNKLGKKHNIKGYEIKMNREGKRENVDEFLRLNNGKPLWPKDLFDQNFKIKPNLPDWVLNPLHSWDSIYKHSQSVERGLDTRDQISYHSHRLPVAQEHIIRNPLQSSSQPGENSQTSGEITRPLRPVAPRVNPSDHPQHVERAADTSVRNQTVVNEQPEQGLEGTTQVSDTTITRNEGEWLDGFNIYDASDEEDRRPIKRRKK